MPPRDRREAIDSPTTERYEDDFVLVDEDVEWDGDQTKFTPPTLLQDAALAAKAAAKTTWANCSLANVRQMAGAAADVGDTFFGARQKRRPQGRERDGDRSRDVESLRDGSGGVGKMDAVKNGGEYVPEVKISGEVSPVLKSREDILVEQMLEAELEDLSAGRGCGHGVGRAEEQGDPLGLLRAQCGREMMGRAAEMMSLVGEEADSYVHDTEGLPGPAQPRYPRPPTRRGWYRDNDNFEPAELGVPRQLLPVEKSGGGK